jgi:predicted alpha/beta hydrolase family esterase
MNTIYIYLIHGYTASKNSNWFPSFKKELQHKNVIVNVLEMPNSKAPKLKEWQEYLEKTVPSFNERTIFIGHSLGCVAILNFLNNKNFKNFNGLFLVSGFVEETPIPELSEFVQTKLDYTSIQNQVKNRVSISAKDDDIIPYEYSEKLAQKLDTEFILLDKGKHFIDRDGIYEFPELVNEVKKLIICTN